MTVCKQNRAIIDACLQKEAHAGKNESEVRSAATADDALFLR